jgi:hypothetical protein
MWFPRRATPRQRWIPLLFTAFSQSEALTWADFIIAAWADGPCTRNRAQRSSSAGKSKNIRQRECPSDLGFGGFPQLSCSPTYLLLLTRRLTELLLSPQYQVGRMCKYLHTTVSCGPDLNASIEQAECCLCGWVAWGTEDALHIAEQAHVCCVRLLRNPPESERLSSLRSLKAS